MINLMECLGKTTIEIDSFGGVAPMQAEGRINGLAFYFRSRYDSYSFSVAREPGQEAPVWANRDEGYYRKYQYSDENDPYAASLLPQDEAIQILFKCIADYLISVTPDRLDDNDPDYYDKYLRRKADEEAN